jgi:hypothetical protein
MAMLFELMLFDVVRRRRVFVCEDSTYIDMLLPCGDFPQSNFTARLSEQERLADWLITCLPPPVSERNDVVVKQNLCR